MGRFGMGLVAVGMMALVGCAGESGASGEAGATGEAGESALTRVVAEPKGANCADGGQAFLVGIDKNDNHQLDDSEVTNKAFVCNGSSSESSVAMRQLPAGDPRCPNGGVAFEMPEGGDLVACNGADGARGAQGRDGEKGAQGDRGIQGAQGEQGLQGPKGEDGADGINGVDGAQGPQGPQGAPAPEPPKLGVFFPSQVVKGMVVTCTTTTETATTVECRGMKVNGLDVYLGPTEANQICSGVTVTGGYDTASGLGVVPAPWLSWDKAASSWKIASAGNASPLQNLTCKR